MDSTALIAGMWSQVCAHDGVPVDRDGFIELHNMSVSRCGAVAGVMPSSSSSVASSTTRRRRYGKECISATRAANNDFKHDRVLCQPGLALIVSISTLDWLDDVRPRMRFG